MHKICFENVAKAYDGQQVLAGFSACLAPGERVALMGPSGQGKTTLVRLLLGLEKPDAGRVDGAAGVRMSCVFQEDRLCEGLTAVQNVALVLPKGGAAKAAAALGQVGLADEDIHKPVRALSGGQRRRVALVRAMEADSGLVVLDEAFNGLDEASRRLAFAYVGSRLAGRTLLVVTHSEDEAALCGRRIYL